MSETINEQYARKLNYERPGDNDKTLPKKGLRRKVKRTYKFKVKAEMEQLRKAVLFAENPLRPDRRNLYSIYFDVADDDQVTTQIRVAQSTIGCAPFEVYTKKGKPDETLTELFERTWFKEYLKRSIETEFWGHSLIEFNDKKKDPEFSNIVLIPREHVRPEYGDVLQQTSDSSGIQFRDNKEFKNLIEIGTRENLGLFKKIAKPYIRKHYADTDWSIYSEKFGMPTIIARTTSRDKSELDAKENMLANIGANGWAILDDQDEIDFMESNNQNGYLTFEKRMELADKQIAKIINGQSSTSDEKAYVGSAEVHERILDDFTKDRLQDIQNHIRDFLIPFLIRHDYPLIGAKFEFTELRKAEGSTDKSPEKKKPQLSLSQVEGVDELDIIYGECCEEGNELDKLNFTKVEYFEGDDLIRAIYDGATNDNYIDSNLFKAYSSRLMKGMAEGFGDKGMGDFGHNLKANDPFYNQKAAFRKNIFDFSAAKVNDLHNELKKLRLHANGNPRSFAEFEILAKARIFRYNHHLQAEFVTARAAAQSARDWQRFEAEKHIFPWLRYDAVMDGRTRDSHRALHGATKKVDDPFWDSYMPPNGWRCRCDVIQLRDAEEKDPDSYPDEKEMPKVFRNNPGKTGKVFSDKHPYFKRSKANKADVKNKVADLYVYDEMEKKADNTVRAHATHDDKERAQNLDIGSQLLKNQTSTKLLPVRIADNVKNPDAEVDGIVADFKEISAGAKIKTAVQRAIKNTGKQLAALCVIDLRLTDESVDELIRGLKAAFQGDFNKRVTAVWILFKKRLVKLTREDIKNNNFENLQE